MTTAHVLILGGTGAASALARAAIGRFGEAVRVTTALAPGTRFPGAIPGDIRIGGFGGAVGIAAYMRRHRVDRLIDAADPFRLRVSVAARIACDATGVPRLLLRPSWPRHPLDRWIEVDDMAAAARTVGRVGRRAWLAVPAAAIACFTAANEVRYLVRLPEPPRHRLPLRYYEVVLGRPPHAISAERHLLQRHAIEVVVCAASGDTDEQAKLIAAREFSMPAIVVRCPAAEPGTVAGTVDAALDWLAALPRDVAEARVS